MSDRLRVKTASGLLVFLTTELKGWSRNKIKQRLQTGCVVVNGETVLKHDYELNEGDGVEVLASGKSIRSGVSKLDILYSDKDLIVINKPAGLLSVATAGENREHAHSLLRSQLSHPKRNVKLWPVHRLDRDTSGVLLFATSREVREAVNAKWDEAEKVYLAIVEGSPPPKGTIDQPLRMDETLYQMHVGAHEDAKNAVTHFQTLRTVNERSLIEVRLETGRQHQIRAHMAWLGHPVVGDSRYGKSGSRMGLHASKLTITVPDSGERLTFETPAPGDFYALLR